MQWIFSEFEEISLKDSPEFDEAWVQDRIAEKPSILKLGDLFLKDRERRHPRAGRLDLLLQSTDEDRRYEVEIQLGSSDESHIIRAIEYWDIERKKYPQYEHVAVLIAENITSRFLNVISLFNGTIPLIAIQMKALKNGNDVGLFFTTVLDQTAIGIIDEDDEREEIADRSYWENKVDKITLSIADDLLDLAKETGGLWEIKYKKSRITVSRKDRRGISLQIYLKKVFAHLSVRIPQSEEISKHITESGLDSLDYKYSSYRLRLFHGDVTKYADIIKTLILKLQEE